VSVGSCSGFRSELRLRDLRTFMGVHFGWETTNVVVCMWRD